VLWLYTGLLMLAGSDIVLKKGLEELNRPFFTILNLKIKFLKR
jgi:hypothetical protein